MTEGTVTQWLVKQGTTIAPGTEVADIETTKITLALETEHAGTLRRIVASEGEILPVGAIIGVIAEAGVSATDIDRFIEEFQAKFTVKAAATAVGEEVTASFVDANGLRLRYLELGTGGIPILFVHGFGGDINSWSLNQALLARRRATYALDLPGHGGSSKDIDDGTVGSLASVVVDFMCALDIPNAHLVGHSLGGAVVMTIEALDWNCPQHITASTSPGSSLRRGERTSSPFLNVSSQSRPWLAALSSRRSSNSSASTGRTRHYVPSPRRCFPRGARQRSWPTTCVR